MWSSSRHKRFPTNSLFFFFFFLTIVFLTGYLIHMFHWLPGDKFLVGNFFPVIPSFHQFQTDEKKADGEDDEDEWEDASDSVDNEEAVEEGSDSDRDSRGEEKKDKGKEKPASSKRNSSASPAASSRPASAGSPKAQRTPRPKVHIPSPAPAPAQESPEAGKPLSPFSPLDSHQPVSDWGEEMEMLSPRSSMGGESPLKPPSVEASPPKKDQNQEDEKKSQVSSSSEPSEPQREEDAGDTDSEHHSNKITLVSLCLYVGDSSSQSKRWYLCPDSPRFLKSSPWSYLTQ